MTLVHPWITAQREAFATEVLDLRKLCQWEARWMRGIVSDLVAAHVICKILFFLFSNISIQVGAILWTCCCSQGFCFYFDSSLRFSVPHGTGSILSMCFFFFWIRKLWSNLLKVTQLVRSKVGLRPASSPPAQRFPALLITMVAAGAGSSGSQVMPVDTGSWFLRGMSSELDEKR